MSSPALMPAVLALVLSFLAACGTGHAPDHWGALPSSGNLKVPIPPAGPVPGVPGVSDALVHAAERATGAALDQVNALTEYGHPRQTGNVLEWRSTPGLADAALWRFVLENVGGQWSDPGRIGGPVKPAQSWRFRLEVRRKMATDAAFRTVMEGTRETPEGDWEAKRGGGTVRIDWGAACAVLERGECPEYGQRGTTMQAAFTLAESGRELTLSFSESLPGQQGNTLHSATMHGTADASGAGTLQVTERNEYAVAVPWNGVPSVRNLRWDASGAGRMDYSTHWSSSDSSWGMMRGELCWGANGAATYSREESAAWGIQETGSASACGSFAQVASLP